MDPLAKVQQLTLESEFEAAFDLCQQIRINATDAIDARYYYGAAYALFSLGHIHQSEKWVQYYGEVTNFGVGYLFLNAYLELHKGHPEQSLLNWTRILELDPANTFADPLIEDQKNALEQQVQRSRNMDLVHVFIPIEILDHGEKGDKKIEKFNKTKTPKESLLKKLFFNTKWIGIAFLVSFVLIGIYYPPFNNSIRFLFAKYFQKQPLPELPVNGTVIDKKFYNSDQPRFFYSTKKQAVLDFKKARQLIVNQKGNQARFLLGKIETSNVSFEIKERALQLRDAIPRSTMASFNDVISFEKIKATPWLYRGAELVIKGKIKGSVIHQQNIQRFYLESKQWNNSEIMILYDFGPTTGRNKKKNLKNKTQIVIFGEFIPKTSNRVVIHAKEIEFLE